MAAVLQLAMAMALLYLSCAVRNRLASKGPMLWPLLGIVPTLIANYGNVYDWITRDLAGNGGTFLFRGVGLCGLSGVVTSVPANVEHILKTNFANYPKGKYFRERFAELLGDGIFNADGETWRAQRRAAVVELHARQFVEFSFEAVKQLVHEKLLPFVDGVERKSGAIDLQELLLRFTFDSISAAAFGVSTGCLPLAGGEMKKVAFSRAFEDATECSLFRFVVPPFAWKLMRRMNVGTEKSLRSAVRVVRHFAAATVAERRNEKKQLRGLSERSDLLSRLMESDNTDGAGGYSDEFLTDFCISFILAGRDTSSVALAWFFWLLSSHPQVESRIIQEITSVVNSRDAANIDEDVAFTAAEIQKMDYLHAALSEAMRLYPPVPVDFKEAIDDDVLPDGTPVLAGQRVLYSIYSIGRSASVWGDDCLDYKPERWVAPGGGSGEPSAYKYAVFNGGPRLCAGKKLAYVQMKYVAASVMWKYHVVPVGGQTVKPKLTTTLYMKSGLAVQFVRRCREHVDGHG